MVSTRAPPDVFPSYAANLKTVLKTVLKTRDMYADEKLNTITIRDSADAVRLAGEGARLEESVEKHPVTPGPLLPARELEGDLLMELGRPADALAEYRRTLAKEPGRYRALDGARRAVGHILAALVDRYLATRDSRFARWLLGGHDPVATTKRWHCSATRHPTSIRACSQRDAPSWRASMTR